MSKPFLIIGLPRTRGTWLSVACSLMPGAICYHEASALMDRWEGNFDIWARAGYDYVGISDSLLGLHLGEILDRIAPRILIVNRPIQEVERSFAMIGYPSTTNLLDIFLSRIEPYRTHPLACEVEFDDLADIDVVECVLEHLMPGMRINRDKLAEIMHINCQEDLDRTRRLALRADFGSMFGQDVMSQLREKPVAL